MIRKILAVFVTLAMGLFALIAWSYSGAIGSVSVAEKVVVLTYDDGPNPPHTQAMLDMLAHHQVRATFFLKGRNVEAYPAAVQAVADAGHEIGNHSYYHRPMTAFGKTAMRDELLRTNRLIENLLGYQPVLFRPPFGAQGPGLKLALEELNMDSILMSTHGADWEVSDPAVIASAVLESVEPGSIILLHDGHGDVDEPASQDSRQASVVATGLIIEALRARGYAFVTVGELMAMADS